MDLARPIRALRTSFHGQFTSKPLRFFKFHTFSTLSYKSISFNRLCKSPSRKPIVIYSLCNYRGEGGAIPMIDGNRAVPSPIPPE